MGLKPRAKAASSDLKTHPTRASVREFIAGLTDERRRRESETLVELMRAASGVPPVMWGSSIVRSSSARSRR